MCEILFIDGDDIFGYGLNVAARVENECEPGGVFLSEDAYRQVRGKCDQLQNCKGARPRRDAHALSDDFAASHESGDTAPSSAEIVASIAAPNGRQKAVIFFLAGPGFAPGSHQYVGVVPTAQADSTAWADRSKIFQSDCGALGETYDEMKKSVTWKSAQTLQIAFDPNRGCAWINQIAGRPGFDVVYVISSFK